jgi:hypothetical protein
VSDNHTGLPHDLPEYVPNWPVPAPVKVPAKVFKGKLGWIWGHCCPRRQRHTLGFGYPTQQAAFAAALKHARGCW